MTNVARTNRNNSRPRSDHYGTPAAATRALLREIRSLHLVGGVWEPAAGRGAIVRVLDACGYRVVATDKYRYRGVAGGRDFLKETTLAAPSIVTNPPYGEIVGGKRRNLADAFIRHALGLRPGLAAFFLPLVYWAGIDRTDLLEGVVAGMYLAEVLVFRDRVTLTPHGYDDRAERKGKGKAQGVVAYAWFIWRRGPRRPVVVRRITARGA